MRSFEPQTADHSLAPHAHRVTLTARRGVGLRFPALCPACGGPAAGELPVRKVFARHHDESPTTYVVQRIAVPFCAPCIARHRAEEETQTRAEQLRRALLSEMGFAALFPGAAALFVWAKLALPAVARGDAVEIAVFGGVGALFALISLACARAAWHRTARERVPPQTSVTRAFDYSDDLSDTFDDPRFVYAIHDPTFFHEFRTRNAELAWDPASPRARSAARKRTLLYVAVGTALLLVAGWDYLVAFWEWLVAG